MFKILSCLFASLLLVKAQYIGGFSGPMPYAQPAQAYAQPAQEYAKPAQQYAQPAQEYAKPAQAYAQPAQEYAKPAQQYAQPTQEYAKPAQAYAQPAQAYAQSAQAYAQPAQEYAKPAQAYAQPAQEYAQPAQKYAQPAQAYAQSAQAYAQPAQSYAQPAQAYAQPAQMHVQPTQYVQPAQPGSYGVPATTQKPATLAPVTPKASEGKCAFDKECWETEPNRAIAHAIMFHRITGISCEECQLECGKFQDAGSPWICRSLTYDHRWFICDLYAVKADQKPHMLAEYPGRDYFNLIGDGSCLAGTTVAPTTEAPVEETTGTEAPETTTEAAVEDVCEEGTAPVFCKWEGTALAGVEGNEYADAESEQDCLEACENNAGNTQCLSFQYADDVCTLLEEKTNEGDPNDSLEKKQGTDYYEKACIPEDLAANSPKVFSVVSNFILVGHVQEVTDAASVGDCKVQCLNAQEEFGFECASAMYYPTDEDQNCLLNSETHLTQPEVFVPEDQGVSMVYIHASEAKKFSRRLKDDVVVADRWTQWSSCNRSSTGYRHRYLKCKSSKDVRKCTKQTRQCPSFNVKNHINALGAGQKPVIGKCVAVRNLRGEKRCPHGILTTARGERKYCSNPIDC